MASLRAIEGGFSLLRSTRFGLSAGFERTVARAWQSSSDSDERMLLAALPSRRVETLYSRIGNAFTLACAALSIFVLAAVALRGRKQRLLGAELGARRRRVRALSFLIDSVFELADARVEVLLASFELFGRLLPRVRRGLVELRHVLLDRLVLLRRYVQLGFEVERCSTSQDLDLFLGGLQAYRHVLQTRTRLLLVLGTLPGDLDKLFGGVFARPIAGFDTLLPGVVALFDCIGIRLSATIRCFLLDPGTLLGALHTRIANFFTLARAGTSSPDHP